jgi:hypothetical protein
MSKAHPGFAAVASKISDFPLDTPIKQGVAIEPVFIPPLLYFSASLTGSFSGELKHRLKMWCVLEGIRDFAVQ